MAEIWGDKLPTVADVYKLYDEEKFQEFKFAAAVLLQAGTSLPVNHVIKITILASNVAVNRSIATKLHALAQEHYHKARALHQEPAQVRVLDRLGEQLETLGKAIEADVRGLTEEEGKQLGGVPKTREDDDNDSSLDNAENDEAAKTQNHKEQERQEELAGLQGQEAFNAHQALCKLMQAQAEVKRLEHELERQKKEKARHRNRLRITLKEERKGLVTKIQESQARIEEIDVLLE